MIWFFGTSHTDGFADGIKHTDKPTFAELTAKKLKMDYINFATSGSDNLQMYKAMKAAINDKSLARPDYIIIEPRCHYSFKDFPKLYNCSDSINLEFQWRNKNDAIYIGYSNEYSYVYKAWNDAYKETDSKFKRNDSKFLKAVKRNLLTYQSYVSSGNAVQALDENNNSYWVPADPLEKYDEWIGIWYTHYLSLVSEIFHKRHDIAYTKLEQEISSLVLLATTITDNVGYFIWNFSDAGDETTYKERLSHLKKYQIFDQTVHSVLRNKHPKEYETSLIEYVDEHLGPTAHKVLSPYITKWIKNRDKK